LGTRLSNFYYELMKKGQITDEELDILVGQYRRYLEFQASVRRWVASLPGFGLDRIYNPDPLLWGFAFKHWFTFVEKYRSAFGVEEKTRTVAGDSEAQVLAWQRMTYNPGEVVSIKQVEVA